MKIIELYEENLKNKINCDSILKQTKEDIIKNLQRDIINKFGGHEIKQNIYKYELNFINVELKDEELFYSKKCQVNFIYKCTSNLPKDKKIYLEETFQTMRKNNYFFYCHRFKNPLWKIISYECKLDKMLDGNLDFELIK